MHYCNCKLLHVKINPSESSKETKHRIKKPTKINQRCCKEGEKKGPQWGSCRSHCMNDKDAMHWLLQTPDGKAIRVGFYRRKSRENLSDFEYMSNRLWSKCLLNISAKVGAHLLLSMVEEDVRRNHSHRMCLSSFLNIVELTLYLFP